MAGLGRAGQAAAEALLREFGPGAVRAWDGSTRPALLDVRDRLAARDVRVELGGDGTALLDAEPSARSVVKSPGIGFEAPLISAAMDRGLNVIDELELGWRLCPAPLVAVTGTNGKSSVCALIQAAVAAAGVEAPLAGNTRFGPPLSAVEASEEAIVVCEVSSYQLEGCPAFLPELAVFTNLSCDHLERHGTIAECGACKARMFHRQHGCAPVAVVNVGDVFGRELARHVRRQGGRVIGFGEVEGADYRLRSAEWTLDSGLFEIETPREPLRLPTRLPGAHNGLNVAASLAAADSLGLDPRSAEAIGAMPGVAGRFEAIRCGQPFDVVVDFAHTPDGIANALGAARAILQQRGAGRLSVVLGALSILAPAQREQMGREAARQADRLVLTTDSRGAGQPSEVLPDLIAGAESAGAEPTVIADRRRALESALGEAAPEDLVIILGRGSLDGPLFDPAGGSRPFDDRGVAGEVLTDLVGQHA